jgi:hypothetical protein
MQVRGPSRLPPGEAPIVFHRRAVPSRGAELTLHGYTRRTTAAGARLEEIVAEYRRIGFEVEVVVHERDPDGCNVCFEDAAVAKAGYRDVYVRAPDRPTQPDGIVPG